LPKSLNRGYITEKVELFERYMEEHKDKDGSLIDMFTLFNILRFVILR
jgi:hypothetical protein